MEPVNEASTRPTDSIAARLQRLAPWFVGLLFFALYAATAAPSIAVIFDDSLEFQLVLPTFGIAHPTGYPLYTLLGGLWNLLLPLGNWAWRANLFSALAGAAAVALVFVVARRLITPHPLPPSPSRLAAPLLAALAFGLGPVWWMQTTLAEVYALHNLLVAAILAVAVGIEAHTRAAFDRRMALLFLLVGLGLAHHRTTVLVIPGLAVYLLWSVPGLWRPRRVWWLWAAALLTPLLLYLYLPLRAAGGASDLHGSYANTWVGFGEHVLATGYTGFFGAVDLRPARGLGDWLRFAVTQLGWPAALLAVGGLANLAAPPAAPRRAWVMVAVIMVTNILFALLYQVGDQEVFLLPALLCAALFAGGGAGLILRGSPPRYGWLAGVLLVLATLAGLGRGAPINRSQDWAVHDYAVDMATVDFPPGSRVLGIEGEMTALRYMQQAAGLGLRATPIAADQPDVRRQRLAEAVAAGVPVYLTRELEGIADQYSFSGAGPLVRVWPRGRAEAGAPTIPLNLALLDGAATITGYDLQRLDWAGGPVARLTLYWLPATQISQTLKVSLRLVDGAGAPLTGPDGAPAVEDRFPLRQVAPTTAWLPGATVADVHEIALPPAFPVGARLQVILYSAETLAEVGRFEVGLAGW
jgi:hypothetical protein